MDLLLLVHSYRICIHEWAAKVSTISIRKCREWILFETFIWKAKAKRRIWSEFKFRVRTTRIKHSIKLNNYKLTSEQNILRHWLKWYRNNRQWSDSEDVKIIAKKSYPQHIMSLQEIFGANTQISTFISQIDFKGGIYRSCQRLWCIESCSRIYRHANPRVFGQKFWGSGNNLIIQSTS